MVGSVPPRRAPAIAVDPSSSGARLRHARELRRATTSGGNARLRRMSLASVRGPGGITRLVGRSTSSRSDYGPLRSRDADQTRPRARDRDDPGCGSSPRFCFARKAAVLLSRESRSLDPADLEPVSSLA